MQQQAHQHEVSLRAKEGELSKLRDRLNKQMDKDLERATIASRSITHAHVPHHVH